MKEPKKETNHRKLDWTVLNTGSSSIYHTLYDTKKKARKDFRERNVKDYDHTNDRIRKYFLQQYVCSFCIQTSHTEELYHVTCWTKEEKLDSCKQNQE